jgi:PAS domain S-box-containing protein
MVNGGLAWWEIELPSGKCVFSRYKAEMLGYSPKKFNHYEDFTSIVHPDDYEGTMQSMRDHLSGKNERFEIDYRILNSSGKYVWMRDIGKLSNKQTDPDKKIITGIVIDINESKKAALALQESESKFKKMTDDAPILIWESGTDKLCYNFNKVWLEFTGRTLEQEMGNGWAEGVHPEDLENCLEIYTNAFDNRESFSMEFRLKHHSGEYRWVMDNGTPRFTDDGEFWGYIGSCSDTTEIKRKERIILSFAEKYKTLLETSRDGMHLLDTKGNLIECNESFCQMLGYTKEEILTFNVVDWDAQIPIDDIINIVNDIIDKPALFETKHRTKDGGILIVEINAAGVEIDDRKYLYASARDITDRKKAEEELALERKRLADILQGTNAGTWEWNVQTGETIYNERWAEIIGYTLEEISPASIETWAKFAHPDDQMVSGELLEKHFKGELDYYEFESRMKHKDGSWVWILDRGRVHEWDADGKPLLMSGTHQDITGHKNAEEEIKLKSEQLVKTNAEKDKFFSIIAHDLKSPFSGFLGLTKIMAEEMQSLTMAEMQNFSKSMQKSAENLYNLLENLLEWSRMQRGLILFKPMTYDVTLLIEQNITIQMEVAKLKNITLMSSISERIPVQTDEPMFNGIMRNLISNAIKFTPRGGTIEVGTITEGYKAFEVCIYIKDNGIGMDEDTVGKLFKLDEKISRPGTEHEPSTGLGLLLCKDFVELNGGRIWAESEEGIGSTFYLTLPKDVQPLQG